MFNFRKTTKEMNEDVVNSIDKNAFAKVSEGVTDTVKTVPSNVLLFARTKEGATIPSKRDEDGCYDVYACFPENEFRIEPFTVKLVPTGICSAFDSDYRISLRERGSNTKSALQVMAGQIDSNFRGEWFVALYNANSVPVIISKNVNKVMKSTTVAHHCSNMCVEAQEYGAKQDCIYVPYSKAVAQAAVEEVPKFEIYEVTPDEIAKIESNRGTGMLGSSGK
jgi:dUTP pyrophosphatase